MINRIIIPVRRYISGNASMNRLLAYAKGFSKLGIKVDFYFLITDKSRSKIELNDYNIHAEYLWEKVGFFSGRHRFLTIINSLYLLRTRIRNNDAILVYGRTNYMLLTVLSSFRRKKVFCEITEHPEYQGNQFFQSLSIHLSLYLLKRLDGLFVISQSLREYFICKGLQPDKVHVINMFVDPSRFLEIKKISNHKYIAYCGSVSKIKDGVDILIRSFAIFHKKHPEYYLYIIGGKGDDEPLSFFEKIACDLGIRESIFFTGKVSAEEMPKYLVNASILALSRPDSLQARNGFPTKLGEYLATGNPVLVTDVGEIPFFIKHGINGYIAEESNVNDFAQKLIWIADHYTESVLIGKKGRDLVNNEFSSWSQSKIALDVILNS